MQHTKLSPTSEAVRHDYLHFKYAVAECSIPYFNNKTLRARGSLGVFVGKGSPKEIHEEVSALFKKKHFDPNSLTSETLKNILVDNNLGIDCSGLAYYILDAECKARNKRSLAKNITFAKAYGLLGSLAAALHPAKNIDVATLADDHNSTIIPISEIRAGDMITMMTGADNSSGSERNHILIVHEKNSSKIFFTHSVAYPEDGKFNSGVRQGSIVLNPNTKIITDALWSEENEANGNASQRILERAKNSRTEVRRLRAFIE